MRWPDHKGRYFTESMTLILSQVGSAWVVQASDRLVTRQLAASVDAYDATANKVVLFFSRDALVCIAYSGLSYIGKTPTDHWIAEVLHGAPLEEYDGRPVLLTRRRAPNANIDVGRAVSLLCSGLTAAALSAPSMWRDAPVELAIAGWQWARRKRRRPIYISVYRDGSGEFVAERSPRHNPPGFLLVAMPTGYLSRQEELDLVEVLKALNPVDVERALVAAIRRVADRSPKVGADCMRVLIPPPEYRSVFVTFDSSLPVLANVRLASGSVTVPSVYSPWVVGPGLVLAPSLLGGGSEVTVGVGSFEVKLKPPQSAGSASGRGVQFQRSQTRILPPP